MFADKSLNILKNVVIFMGLVLIVGVLFMFKLLGNKIKDSSNKSCDLQEINLTGSIEHIAMDDHKIAFYVNDNGSKKLIIIDDCKKEKERREILIK